MATSAPILDALKAEKSAQRDKRAVEKDQPHYNDAAQVSKKNDSKKNAGDASGDKKKRQFNCTTRQTSRKVSCGGRCSLPEGVRSGCLHVAAEDRKRIRCFTCGQTISHLSEQGQVRARQQAST